MADERGRLGNPSESSERDWLGYRNPQQADESDFRLGSIARGPKAPLRSMSTQELANFQRRFSTYARLRLLGPGAEQYVKDGRQQFEGMSHRHLVQEMVDELADLVNYATMLAIQLQRIPDKLEGEL